MLPITRNAVADRTVPDQADRLRELITPAIPLGYRREQRVFDLSEDRRTERFTVVDVQLPNPLPDGVVSCSASHSVESRVGLRRWQATLSAHYETALGVSPRTALAHFFTLAFDRMFATRAALDPAEQGGLIPVHLRLNEPDLYGRPALDVSLVYTYASSIVSQAVGVSSLCGPVPGTDFSRWSAGMAQLNVSGPRGLSQFKFDPADDLIVDLCLINPIVAPPPPAPPVLRTSPPPDTEAELRRVFTPPEEGKSWLLYELEAALITEDETYELKPLPPPGWSPGGQSPPSVIQRRAQPSTYLILSGRALRGGYEIPVPSATSVGQLTPVPANVEGYGYRAKVVANVGVPVYGAAWSLRYLLPSPPAGQVPSPDNPLLGGPGPNYGLTTTGGPGPLLAR